MPPIPLHTNSPINPAKASGITPQTASPNNQPTPTKTTSIPSQSNNSGGPPPPQPGAIPQLPAVTPFPTSSTSPPAPAPAPAVTQAPTYPPPLQTSIPAPEKPYNQRGTSTAFTPRTPTGAAVLPGPSPYESGRGVQGYQQQSGSGYQPSGGEEGEGGAGVLGSVMGYAKAAGEKLSEAEREVWRRINGEK